MRAIILGAGGVGLGFLGELLTSSGGEITFADIDSDLVGALNAQHSYIFNKVGKQIQQVRVSPVRAIDLSEAGAEQQLSAALAEADLVFTAAGAGAFAALGKLLAAAAETTDFAQEPLNVLCCENHHNAAAALSEATGQAGAEAGLLAEKFAFTNTVVARMCQRLTVRERDLSPVAPGLDVVIVAESYGFLPADARTVAPPVPDFEGLRLLPGPVFEAWDHRKLFAHNGTHALLGVLGKLAGHTYMYECRRDLDIDAVGRRAMWEEVGGALLSAHPQVFTPADHDAFAADLYGRITSELFADTVDRATRNTMRMISPEDGRLSAAAEFVLQQGGVPRALALGIAGVLVLNGKSVAETAGLLAHIDPVRRADLIELTTQAFEVITNWQSGGSEGLGSFVR